jgi:hypothetical protein
MNEIKKGEIRNKKIKMKKKIKSYEFKRFKMESGRWKMEIEKGNFLRNETLSI